MTVGNSLTPSGGPGLMPMNSATFFFFLRRMPCIRRAGR
jgi:hypothetical protein